MDVFFAFSTTVFGDAGLKQVPQAIQPTSFFFFFLNLNNLVIYFTDPDRMEHYFKTFKLLVHYQHQVVRSV